MNINIHNYEEFALDYLEGNLSEPQLTAFSNFLKQYPKVRQELEGFEPICISDDDLEPTPFFSKKEELYKEVAVVSLLKRPVPLKVWQIAAAFILLLSSVWVINSYYLDGTPSNNPIAIAELERISPKVEVIKEVEEVVKEEVQFESTELVATANTEEIITEPIATAEPSSETQIVDSGQTRTFRESEVELAFDAEVEFVKSLSEDEDFENLYFEELMPELNRQEKRDIAMLPVNQMMLEMPSEPLDIATQKLLWNPVYVEAIDEELHLIRFFANLAERILPDQVASNLNKIDVNINTERIPQELLPRFMQQSN